MSVRRVIAAVVGLACVGVLSSCALLPPGSSGDEQSHAGVQMEHIADAVKNHDAAALKSLFSPTAREKATDLDNGLAYFLSVFPSGLKTWTIEDGAPGSAQYVKGSYTEEEVYANYKVAANGREYTMYFADLTVNTKDPKNVGIYALGVTPYADERTMAPGAKTPFDKWASQFDSGTFASGIPGVYVPAK